MDEKELYELKWFDHRALTPEVATLAFMSEWAKAFVNYNEELGKTKYYAFLKSFKSFDLAYLKENKRFKSLGKLRKLADTHMMRYDLYWHWAFEAHLELRFGKTFENVFLNKSIQAKILEYKRAHDENFITYAKSDIFTPENYRNLELQNDYYGHLVNEVKKRYAKEHWQMKIEIMIENGRLSKEFFCEYYSVIT